MSHDYQGQARDFVQRRPHSAVCLKYTEVVVLGSGIDTQGRQKMRKLLTSRAVLFSAFLALVGCGNGGDAQMSKNPLLPAGAELDLIRISEAVWAREAAGGAKALSPAERVFLCVWNLEAEVNNGGFEQFYINSAGDNALATPIALREIGATQAAAIAEEANNVFPPPGPAADPDDRAEALDRMGEVATDALSALDASFYEYPDNLEELLRGFVDNNRDQFYEP
jgi:hypothetical protein